MLEAVEVLQSGAGSQVMQVLLGVSFALLESWMIYRVMNRSVRHHCWATFMLKCKNAKLFG